MIEAEGVVVLLLEYTLTLKWNHGCILPGLLSSIYKALCVLYSRVLAMFIDTQSDISTTYQIDTIPYICI